MKTRRTFLKYGVTAAAAALLPRRLPAQAEPAPASAGAPAPTGLIDLHNHWISPGAIDVLSTRTKAVRYVTGPHGEHTLVREVGPPVSTLGSRAPQGLRGTQMYDGADKRLRHLDAHGVSRQLISWPTTMNVDPALTADEAHLLWGTYNDDLAALVRAHPDRFSAVAALSTLDIAWSVKELARGHDKLGLIGGVLPVNGFATLEGAKAFAPLFEAAQKYKSLIYLHTGYAHANVPGQPPYPKHEDSRPARAALDNLWNFTAATVTLAFSGFLDAYPDVTVQVAQLGGAGGIGLVAEAVQQAAPADAPLDLRSRFKRIYLDTGAAGRGPEAIALAVRVFGAEQIVLGTDYGAANSVVPVIDNIEKSPLTAADRQKILIENPKAILAAQGVAV